LQVFLTSDGRVIVYHDATADPEDALRHDVLEADATEQELVAFTDDSVGDDPFDPMATSQLWIRQTLHQSSHHGPIPVVQRRPGRSHYHDGQDCPPWHCRDCHVGSEGKKA
ncbi:MAG TPA: hypothetical protein VFI54_07675, partial [Solirubrobacteraceae bacterium]|nr:hypothetical protein [Solirubrobacteraceae bacterium]